LSLTRCLAIHARILKDFDTSEIKEAALSYAEDGLSQQEAELKAIDDKLAEISKERARINRAVAAAWAAARAAQTAKFMEVVS
jgi:hypothetical protein